MGKRKKEVTIADLAANVKESLARWSEIRRKGTQDPAYHDGTNMNLVRRHVMSYKDQLKALCKTQKAKCPPEAKAKTPPAVPEDYCAKRSKAGPCRAKRALKK